MLSETAKLILSRAIETAKREGAFVDMQHLGPAEIIDQAIEECHACARECDNPEVHALPGNVEANRPEAERFMAGLLGMM
jgi:hypothetical protein